MGTRVTIRPTGKRVFFSHELGNIIMKIIYAPQYNGFAKFQIHATLYPDVETREGKEQASMPCGVIPMQFHIITYGMELYTNDSIPINTNIEHASERSERAKKMLALLHS